MGSGSTSPSPWRATRWLASTKARASSKSCIKIRCCRRSTDRRTVGRWGIRVPGREFPAELERVERKISRYRPQVLERRRGTVERFRAATQRKRRPVSTEQSWTSRQRQLRHRSRRFHLRDLVSYNDKHNEANGEDNQDGASDNESWNWGAKATRTTPGSGVCARNSSGIFWRR